MVILFPSINDKNTKSQVHPFTLIIDKRNFYSLFSCFVTSDLAAVLFKLYFSKCHTEIIYYNVRGRQHCVQHERDLVTLLKCCYLLKYCEIALQWLTGHTWLDVSCSCHSRTAEGTSLAFVALNSFCREETGSSMKCVLLLSTSYSEAPHKQNTGQHARSQYSLRSARVLSIYICLRCSQACVFQKKKKHVTVYDNKYTTNAGLLASQRNRGWWDEAMEKTDEERKKKQKLTI